MRAAPRADNAPPFRPDAPRRSAAVPWLPVLLVLVGHGLEASARVSGAEPDGAAPAGAAAAATEPDEMDVPTRVRIDQLVKSARLAAEAGKPAARTSSCAIMRWTTDLRRSQQPLPELPSPRR